MKNHTPIWKIAATIGGTGLTASATWLNAQHVATSEGWASPLVFAGIFVTLCAASAPPLAERAAKTGQPLKAAMLWAFFALALAFSLSSSISRSSGYVAGKIANAEQANEKAGLAKEAYEAAKKSAAAECVKRGDRCRDLEKKADAARAALLTAAPVQSADPGAERVAAVLGVSEASVQLYVPLLLPLGLELGGFIFVALGLAPRKREDECEAVASPVQQVASQPEPVAKPADVIANLCEAVATPIAKQGAIGTKAYYMARLAAEAPQWAEKVRNGELSCFAASIAAGLRKPPKARKWDANDYGAGKVAEAL